VEAAEVEAAEVGKLSIAIYFMVLSSQNLKDPIIIGLPVLVLIVGLWWRHARGNGPRAKGAIIPHYEPPADLTPAEVSVIMFGKVTTAGIMGEIIELARQGFLRIIRTKEKVSLGPDTVVYTFERLKSADELEASFRQDLMKAISIRVLSPAEEFKRQQKDRWKSLRLFFRELAVGFGWKEPDLSNYNPEVSQITMKQLKNVLSERLRSSKNMLSYRLSERRYLLDNSELWIIGRGVIGLIGVLMIYLIMATIYGDKDYFYEVFYPSLFLSLFIVIAVIWKASIYRPKGQEAKDYLLGYALYLQTAEKGRLEFYPEVDGKAEAFELALPYALALGVETEWAQKFQTISLLTPDWYARDDKSRVTSTQLVNELQTIVRQFSDNGK
jgi:hypothetical protein